MCMCVSVRMCVCDDQRVKMEPSLLYSLYSAFVKNYTMDADWVRTRNTALAGLFPRSPMYWDDTCEAKTPG